VILDPIAVYAVFKIFFFLIVVAAVAIHCAVISPDIIVWQNIRASYHAKRIEKFILPGIFY